MVHATSTTSLPDVTRPLILDNALGGVGYTPMVRLDRLAKQFNIKSNLFGKVEFMSIGGSVKDRIAKRMVEQAEKDGILIPGKSVVIEPTSGNTGIGLALACAVHGYPLIITLPEKMSLEKELTMRALGAEIIRTPTAVASSSPLSNLGMARRLKEAIPNAVVLDQYGNPNNPLAHEFGTGPEIVAAIESLPENKKVDVFIAGAGTGGTISGTARVLKRHNKDVVVVGVDPRGSVLALPESLNKLDEGEDGFYQIEGIGYDFTPDVLSREPGLIDDWAKVTDPECFKSAKNMMKYEGLLVGGSAGAAIAGTLSWLTADPARDKEGQNVVIILPDGVRNYMSKPWFADGLLGRELGADLAPEVTARINKVIAENDKYAQDISGTVPTVDKAEEAVKALTEITKDAPEIVAIYGLNVPPSLIRLRVREKFEQYRYVTDPAVIDVLLHKGRQEYQETMNCWKQEPHIMGSLLRDSHEGSAVGQTFLQKFYSGRDEESVRIASPAP
ncbi:cystathionine beta-synthase [Ceratobasidium sp. 392]|nr:cystathionine beta-synthase [Ceratobasidium sp. 392]